MLATGEDGQTGGADPGDGGRAAGLALALMAEAATLPDIPAVLTAWGRILVRGGVPVERASLHLRLIDPRIRGLTFIWSRDGGVKTLERQHGIEHTPAFLNSPMRPIMEEGAAGVRVRIDRATPPYRFIIVEELKAEGFTDYAAMPLHFTDGRRQVATIATRAGPGFTTAELTVIAETLPALAALVEVRSLHQLAASLMRTYVGQRTGARILAGEIRRGSGVAVPAVLWYCDLQGFTPLADRLPLQQLIALLNNYFEIMGGAVQDQGGEILKFIGDAILSIFPVELPDPSHVVEVCRRALAAAEQAMSGMAKLNAERAAWGQPLLGGGIALHLGDVMYGNIGAPDRLDFTVIGPAVNLVSRLQGLTRRMQRPLLTSATFAGVFEAGGRPTSLVSLGFQPVRGLNDPVEVFGLGA